MSLKSRLLKNRELKSQQFASITSDCDLLEFFREHKEFDTITAYKHDSIFGEKDGNKIKIPISFSNTESYFAEVEKIAKLYNNFPDKKNPQVTICTPSNSIIKIIVPPIVENEPFISFHRENKQLYTSYFSSKIISSEIVSYLRDCISQKANIFIIGNANIEKTSIMNFLINLTENDKKNILCGETENINIEKPCSIRLNQEYLDKINEIDYDNVFYLNEKNENLTKIFKLILSGHNGFVVSLSMKENVDILSALRNIILLENMNLFEENADFLTASAIDIVITVEKNEKNISISKISEIIKNNDNKYLMKDIFTKTNDNLHISTGNSSKFFNSENSQRYLKEFMEEGHKHSYVSGKTEVLTEPVSTLQSTSKHKKLKEKLKKLKKEKITIEPKEELETIENTEETNSITEEILNETESTKNSELTFFGKNIDEINTNEQPITQETANKNIIEKEIIQKPDFQTVLESSAKEENEFHPSLPKPKITNIFDIDDEDENNFNRQEDVDNYDKTADIETLLKDDGFSLQDNKLDTFNQDFSEKYKDTPSQIIEEPQLFSEISDDDIEDYEREILEVPDEDI